MSRHKPIPSVGAVFNLEVLRGRTDGSAPGCLLKLPDDYEVHLYGANKTLAILEGRNTLIDTCCTYMALPYDVWSYWGLELSNPAREHPRIPLGRTTVRAGECQASIYRRGDQGNLSLVWPGSRQGLIPVKACLLRKSRARIGWWGGLSREAKERMRSSSATSLLGLDLFMDSRICIHLEQGALKAGVFDTSSVACFRYL